MFGMENKPKSHANIKFEYELEKELQNPSIAKKHLDHIQERAAKLKQCLREGLTEQNDFEKLSVLLHGYAAFKRIIQRKNK